MVPVLAAVFHAANGKAVTLAGPAAALTAQVGVLTVTLVLGH